MRKMGKRAVSFLISVSLAVGMVPGAAFAKTEGNGAESDTSVVSTESEENDETAVPEDDTEVVVSEDDTEAVDPEDDTEAAVSEDDTEAVDPEDDTEAVDPEDDTEAAVTDEDKEDAATKAKKQKDAKKAKTPAMPKMALSFPAGAPEPVAMTLAADYSVATEENKYWLGSFTVPEDAKYYFYSCGASGDPMGLLYENESLGTPLASNDDRTSQNNKNSSVKD